MVNDLLAGVTTGLKICMSEFFDRCTSILVGATDFDFKRGSDEISDNFSFF